MRREKLITVEGEGRDKGKTYKLREMSTVEGEKWGLRVLRSLARGGVELPEGAFEGRELNIAMVARMGLTFLAYCGEADTDAILDQMLDTVQFVGDLKQEHATTRTLIPDDIEEPETLIMIRQEVWNLNAGFLKAVYRLLSNLIASMKTAPDESGQAAQTS